MTNTSNLAAAVLSILAAAAIVAFVYVVGNAAERYAADKHCADEIEAAAAYADAAKAIAAYHATR